MILEIAFRLGTMFTRKWRQIVASETFTSQKACKVYWCLLGPLTIK